MKVGIFYVLFLCVVLNFLLKQTSFTRLYAQVLLQLVDTRAIASKSVSCGPNIRLIPKGRAQFHQDH